MGQDHIWASKRSFPLRFGREVRLDIDPNDDCEVNRGVDEDDGPSLSLAELDDALSRDDGDGELDVCREDCWYGSYIIGGGEDNGDECIVWGNVWSESEGNRVLLWPDLEEKR